MTLVGSRRGAAAGQGGAAAGGTARGARESNNSRAAVRRMQTNGRKSLAVYFTLARVISKNFDHWLPSRENSPTSNHSPFSLSVIV